MKIVCQTAKVFTNDGKMGNGLGVVTDARRLNRAMMQTVAATLGFSETSFVFPAPTGADYRVRFFTPVKEIPFAGHPSIGTLFVLKREGLLPNKESYIQRVGRRMVRLASLADGRISMDQGMPRFGKTLSPRSAAQLLALSPANIAGIPRVVSTGLPHLIVPLRSRSALKSATIRSRWYSRVRLDVGADCIMPFYREGNFLFCRMFAPALGITEDPATGSGCGPLGCYVAREVGMRGGASSRVSFEVLQGMGKGSRLFVWVMLKAEKIERVEVGGRCALMSPRRVKIP